MKILLYLFACTIYFCNIVVFNRQEAEPWLSTLSLEGTPAMESGQRPGPVKPHKAAL